VLPSAWDMLYCLRDNQLFLRPQRIFTMKHAVTASRLAYYIRKYICVVYMPIPVAALSGVSLCIYADPSSRAVWRRSVATWLLGSRVRISLMAWMLSLVFNVRCVASDPWDVLIALSQESYHVCVCVCVCLCVCLCIMCHNRCLKQDHIILQATGDNVAMP
jgi:hypothetical protein